MTSREQIRDLYARTVAARGVGSVPEAAEFAALIDAAVAEERENLAHECDVMAAMHEVGDDLGVRYTPREVALAYREQAHAIRRGRHEKRATLPLPSDAYRDECRRGIHDSEGRFRPDSDNRFGNTGY